MAKGGGGGGRGRKKNKLKRNRECKDVQYTLYGHIS
jgi:hypothetical protein